MASSLLTEIIDDLASEHGDLDALLARLGDDDWERPTHAPGWAVRDQVAHLAQFDDAACAVVRSGDDVLATMGRGGGPSYLDTARAKRQAEIYGWWRQASSSLIEAARTVDPARRLPWAGRDMNPTSFLTARLMECWSHGLDVVDVVPFGRPDTDRLRHVVQIGIRTRPFSYSNRGMIVPDVPIRIELTSPSGALWTFGEEAATDRISGTATDFCHIVTQRRHLADTALSVQGGAALEWMTIAQAFAGPPGQGRQAGEFSGQDPH
jgi:uncharacterized protein (TIGR03084 family)